MDTFGIIGMAFGLIGFVMATTAIRKIGKLEAELKRRGVIESAFNSEK